MATIDTQKKARIDLMKNIHLFVKDFCDQHKIYKLNQESLYHRNYDIGGIISIEYKTHKFEIKYVYEDDQLYFYGESKYFPNFRIKNVSSLLENASSLHDKINAFLHEFISSNLKQKRKIVFADILFNTFDEECLDTIKENQGKKIKLNIADKVCKRYVETIVDKQLWV